MRLLTHEASCGSHHAILASSPSPVRLKLARPPFWITFPLLSVAVPYERAQPTKNYGVWRDSLSSRKRWQTALGQRDERIEANG